MEQKTKGVVSFLLYCLLSVRGEGVARFIAQEVIVFLLIVPRRHT